MGKGVKTSASSFYGFKQWWAALAEATSPAPSSGRHKHAACTAQTHDNSPSATAAASPSSPNPPLSSESRRKREDSAECSKFKCVTFFFSVFFLSKVAICLEILSRQQVPGAAYRWCSGNPGKAFPLFRRGKQLMLSLELFSSPATSQW